MSLLRTALLRASRSRWLAAQAGKRAFARRAVRRFMPGEQLGDALGAAGELAGSGLGSVVTCLGERTTSHDEARAVSAHYMGAIDEIRTRSLPTHVSVKLTHLGLDVDRARCAASVRGLAAHAAEAGTFLWIDIEESHYVDATIAVFREARSAHANVGLCLQAYLRRTPGDLESLIGEGAAIRLVKGAYREPPDVALQARPEVDAAYELLAGRMLERAAAGTLGGPAVFGTHDVRLLGRIRESARTLGAKPESWEVHMLYGIRTADQLALAADGVGVRVLISYGTHWFPWYVRRLAERPANLWFVARSLVG